MIPCVPLKYAFQKDRLEWQLVPPQMLLQLFQQLIFSSFCYEVHMEHNITEVRQATAY